MFSVIQENELITLIVACFVLIFIIVKRAELKSIPFSGILLLAYGVVFAGWTITVLESFFFPTAMNILEHICYAMSSAILALWCYKFFCSPGARK